ncbi:Beta propeller domain protein [Sporotomaculum syntrophicum]|uniref:Beta propeller domain protein n=1 Tax=Sporotomaculum syntrophicum TaxID=182264 RepID=A0A9D3AZT0_9FIRM|nr:beta-propeller domain-containing protein [Sporotomaculum syntrophicum]KAF1086234.1 Beta propeller domain protein [Sporotomaculum syntrophicum]
MSLRKAWYGLLAMLTSMIVLLASFSAGTNQSAAAEPATFQSYEELVDYIEQNTLIARQFGILRYGEILEDSAAPQSGAAPPEAAQKNKRTDYQNEALDTTGTTDYSSTNNQVQGVDEADKVKTDGEYLYVISGQKLTIIKANPVAESKKLSTIHFEGQPVEAFINVDTLLVFGSSQENDLMFMHKYNVANRENPVLVKEVKCSGYYLTSRMIGSEVYAIVNAPTYRYEPASRQNKIVLPELTVDGQESTIDASSIHYFNNPDNAYNYTLILSLNMQDNTNQVQSKTFLTGTSQNIFASTGHLYLTGNKMPDYALHTQKLLDGLAELVPADIARQIRAVRDSEHSYTEKTRQAESILEEHLSSMNYLQAAAMEEKIRGIMYKFQQDIGREQNKTVIHKMALLNCQVKYRGQGEVNGRVLNQFSMDEYNGYFRIATTSEGFLSTTAPATRNNIYVLDDKMKVTGQLLGLAPTERIYSARFMSNRAYLVTFRQTDPLFVVDLANPEQPKLLGQLKIPGYSDYLQPYDDNHLIGIGREVTTVPVSQPFTEQSMIMPPPTREQGVKIALFDVTNPTAPREIAKYVIDRDDSDSAARHDHRAVLFSKEKNLLVIPVSYGSTWRIMPMDTKRMLPYFPEWQGTYVFDISPEKGIKLRGKLEHRVSQNGASFYDTVSRSLYIGDVLYTISEQQLKMYKLDNLKEIRKIAL